MTHLTTTPFGPRPVSAVHLQQIEQGARNVDLPRVDKWELFRELTVAKAAFNLTDRDLTVLNALLSFYQGPHLEEDAMLMVFPSNRSLAERAHGMAESTMRRHLSALVRSGLILRHDSPNGKRYAMRGQGGDIDVAFGFDLRPLLVYARQISIAADEVRAATERLKRLRTGIVLKLRDADKLAEYGQQEYPSKDWAEVEDMLHELRKGLRRKIDFEVLERLEGLADTVLTLVKSLILPQNVSANDSKNEQHHTNSNTDSSDFEPSSETAKGAGQVLEIDHRVCGEASDHLDPPTRECPIPLGLVVRACPDIAIFGRRDIRSWYDLVSSAADVRASMGISPSAWADAQEAMGIENAAVTVAAILERMADIQNPGGYLRALTRKAQTDGFSPGPMIMALLSTKDQAA